MTDAKGEGGGKRRGRGTLSRRGGDDSAGNGDGTFVPPSFLLPFATHLRPSQREGKKKQGSDSARNVDHRRRRAKTNKSVGYFAEEEEKVFEQKTHEVSPVWATS